MKRLHPKQQQVLNEAKRFNVLNCGRRWGKSQLAIDILCRGALSGFPVAYFTPTYKLLEGTFDAIYATLLPLVTKKHDNQIMKLLNGGSIEFWTLDNPLAGRSRKYKTAIIDEAAWVKELEKTWNEAIRATLTDMQGDAWFMSTPKGKNGFYSLYMKGEQQEQDWASWTMPTITNPYINEYEVESAQKSMDKLAFAQEYLATFNDNAANPFGGNYIDMCTMPLSNNSPVCFGVDLAKSSDWTVIIGLDKAGFVCYFDRYQKDWNSTKHDIINLPNVPIRLDSTGVGDPILEDVQRHKSNVSGEKYTMGSKQQLMEGLALAIQQRKIAFPEGLIKKELESFGYEYTKYGVRYSAPTGVHDDCVNALALAWKEFNLNGANFKYVFI